jgi:hypothetical protein
MAHFSRKIYDNCYSLEFVDQQVNPCKYRTLDDFAESNNKCHALNGPRTNRNRATGELGSTNIAFRTDTESLLKNLDVPDSRCITMNTMKEKNERLSKHAKSLNVVHTNCSKESDTIYSRLDAPVNDLRSVYINRFEFPIIPPSEFVYYGTPNTDQINNQRWGVNTQLAAKDKVMKPNMNPTSVLTK